MTKYLWVLAALPFIVILAFYIYFSTPYFPGATPWKDIDIAASQTLHFSLNPKTLYDNYRTIQLAVFYQAELEDPLFANDGLSKDGFAQAIDNLTENNTNFKKNTGVLEDVIPVKFLAKLQDAFSSREAFFSNPSAESGKRLLDSYQETSTIYKQSADKIKEQIEKNTTKIGDKTFAEYGSEINRKVILDDIGKIVKNADYLDQEISKRRGCLASLTFCKRGLLQEKKKVVSAKTPADTTVLPLSERYYDNGQNRKLLGTYIVSSRCWAQKVGSYPIFLYEDNKTTSVVYRPELASNSYFEKLKADSKDSVDQQYLKDGLEWRHAAVTTSYACNDLDYQASLTTIDYFFRTYKTNLIYSQISLGQNQKNTALSESINRGKKLEEFFFSSPYPSEENMNNLSKAYLETYGLMVGEMASGNSATGENVRLKDELLERIVLIRVKTAHIDRILNFSAMVNNTLSRMTSYDDLDRSPYIYLVRNGYPLTMFGFSPSVFRNPDKLRYITAGAIRSDLKSNIEMVATYGQAYVDKISQVSRGSILREIFGNP